MTKQELQQRLDAIEARGANIEGMHERFRLYAAEGPERDAVAMLVHDVLYGELLTTTSPHSTEQVHDAHARKAAS